MNEVNNPNNKIKGIIDENNKSLKNNKDIYLYRGR